MIRAAHERIGTLFALAEREARAHPSLGLANRYVTLARRIGMRYNVRIPPELASAYCRRCSVYWVEGRTVTSRLRGGRRIRRCLACGALRRFRYRAPRGAGPADLGGPRPRTAAEPVLAEEDLGEPDLDEGEGE